VDAGGRPRALGVLGGAKPYAVRMGRRRRQVVEKRYGIIGGEHDVASILADETGSHRPVEEREKRIVEAVDVEQTTAFLVEAKLRPGDGLAQLLEGAEAPRQCYKRVGEVSHQRLPFMHGAHDAKIGQTRMPDLSSQERVRNHADSVASGGEHGVGQMSHEPYASAAEHEANLPGCELAREGLGCFPILRFQASTRPAEDAHSRQPIRRTVHRLSHTTSLRPFGRVVWL
jgi:hypothetical protein